MKAFTMPKTICTNPDVEFSVLRPICFDIARQVAEWTRASNDIPVLFPGEAEVIAQPNSTIDADQVVKLPSGQKIFIEAELEYDENSQLNMAVHQDEHMPYFEDKALGVSLRPVYSPSTIRLNFKLRENDRSAAKRWRDDMRARIARYRGERVHTVNYYYMVPIVYVRLLRKIHELRESNAGYGDTASAYIRNHALRELTTMSTMSGTQARLCVKEAQTRVLGNFDFSLPEKEQKDNETSAHSISFSYTVRVDIPIATAADFPFLVHQQFIPEEFMPVPEDLRPERVASRASKSMAAFRYFEADVRNRLERETTIRIPEFNEYRPSDTINDSILAMAVLTTVEYDSEGKLLPLLNLADIDENFRYKDEWLEFLRTDHQRLSSRYMAPVYIAVTRGEHFLHPSMYTVTEDLDVVLTRSPDLRQTYYVAMYLLKDPSIIPGDYYATARNSVEGLRMYAQAVCPRLARSGGIPADRNGSYIDNDIRTLFDRIRICNRSNSQATHLHDAVIESKLINQLCIGVERKDS